MNKSNKVNCVIYKVINKNNERIADGICKVDHHQLFTSNLPRWIQTGCTVEMRHYIYNQEISDAANNS